MPCEFKDYVLSGRFYEVANQAIVRAVAKAKAHGLKIPVEPAPHRSSSDQNPLDLIKGDLILAPVVGPDGAGTVVVRHLLGYLESTTIAQIFRDLNGSHGVTANVGGYAVILGSASDHPVDVRLALRSAGEFTRVRLKVRSTAA